MEECRWNCYAKEEAKKLEKSPQARLGQNTQVGQGAWKDGKDKITTYRNLEFPLGNAVS